MGNSLASHRGANKKVFYVATSEYLRMAIRADSFFNTLRKKAMSPRLPNAEIDSSLIFNGARLHPNRLIRGAMRGMY